LQVHKVKPETLKSILSLVRNTDNRTTSGVDNSGGVSRDIIGSDKSQQCVSSHGRDTGSDEAPRDVIGEVQAAPVGEAAVDAVAVEWRGSTSELCDAATTQDEQMRLATEGQ